MQYLKAVETVLVAVLKQSDKRRSFISSLSFRATAALRCPTFLFREMSKVFLFEVIPFETNEPKLVAFGRFQRGPKWLLF